MAAPMQKHMLVLTLSFPTHKSVLKHNNTLSGIVREENEIENTFEMQ